LESLAHSGENVLGLLREGKIKSSQQVITILLRTMDALRGILKRISVSGDDGAEEAVNDAPLIRELDQLSGLEAGSVYAAKSREKKKLLRAKKLPPLRNH
jgi:two-component system, chemotaxis family, sensor kinase CheA